jgi:hypothetical protein
MADELENKKVIRKRDPDFPQYLDFNKLRSEGIAYLGKLSGQIWTDHNVHDPGITILEMLCYAILDLGYRTNLPEEDIFTRNPEDKTKDNNFFTPARILANNPLTITDFRKMLVDIEGVRNAWLEPATDVKDICRPPRQEHDYPATYRRDEDSCQCDDFLNGIYHVLLDLENPPAGEDPHEFEKETIGRVRKSLMKHRNFCEDFHDIQVLCKLPMGVCAEIELEDNAEADRTYFNISEALRDFFTPSPRFYTLRELLDRQKPIEDIFAGRPFDIEQSHGFVDREEFEKLRLKKEIHLSDVYNIIFEVPGVKSVRNLSLRLCDDGPGKTDWKFPVKENHIPEFSVQCSGFKFSRNGNPVSVDFNKYEGLFELNFSNNGKILYHAPSPHLDLEIPKGIYHPDLADYYSIQNEFPQVYGIQEGGLSDDAPALRKAQALQLKGYLLFFDQLLANYLTQLKNIRSLFALSSPQDKNDQHTYFINQLDSVPDLQDLLFFKAGGSGSPDPGASGSTLVIPVKRKKFLTLKESNKLNTLDNESIEEIQYAFSSPAERDIAISQIKNDFYNDSVKLEFFTRTDGAVYYYFLTTSDDFVLISKKYHKDLSEAKLNSASVKYIGMFGENYRSVTGSPDKFSFTIDMNLASLANYLQLIVEDREMYLKRREEFLNHLLARFAENFTDYALLSFDANGNIAAREAGIKATERFLTHYDDISSNRGKAYDYYLDNWNNDNISGFEKRVKSVIGVENWKRHSLCNFVVDKYNYHYAVGLKLAGHEFFTLRETFDSFEEGQHAAQSLFSALSDRNNYQLQYVPHEQAYAIIVQNDSKHAATFYTLYDDKNEAGDVIRQLHRLFTGNPVSEGDITISRYIYFLKLEDSKGKLKRTSTRKYDNETMAQLAAARMSKGVNEKERWHPEDDPQPGMLYRIRQKNDTLQFIDLDAFKFDINDTILGSPDKYTYDLLDKRNRFKLKPVSVFDDAVKARDHGHRLLAWMCDPENFKVDQLPGTGKYTLSVIVEDTEEAVYDTDFNSEEEALKMQEKIMSIITRHLYTLSVQSIPDRWKFNYSLGYGAAGPFSHEFESINEYAGPEEAMTAARIFGEKISGLKLQKDKDELLLVSRRKVKSVSPVRLKEMPGGLEKEADERSIGRMLEAQTEVNRLLEHNNIEDFAHSVDLDEISKQGLFVYRLIDKDNIPAMYRRPFSDKKTAGDKKAALAKIKCGTYKYLRICLGGDNIIRENGKGKKTEQYKYVIKTLHSSGQTADPLVLFESADSYSSKEEAQKAFDENYLRIMELASGPENYENKISLGEIPVRKPGPGRADKSIVYVPDKTMATLGDHDDASVRALVAIARTYPVRRVELQSGEFYRLFPCETPAGITRDRDCNEEERKDVYYFRLNDTGDHEDDSYWQSTGYFKTPEEAWQEFQFFLMLLCYPGNLFVDCDLCNGKESSFRIYIREVLAESTRRFINEKDAWGKEGVQKFICVSQSPNSFHTYQHEDNCCYSFYLSCADTPFYHPCKYNSPGQRDRMINMLYSEFKKSRKNQAYHLVRENETYFLLNDQGQQFARIDSRYRESICNSLVELLERIARDKADYERDDNGIVSIRSDDGLVLSSLHGVEVEKWRIMLEDYACYFPVVKTKKEGSEREQYCIEIKLPGFNTCDESRDAEKNCDCGDSDEKDRPACYMAWKSRCCFPTCEEAEYALQDLELLLSQYENYQPLFDCGCREFGIALKVRRIPGLTGRQQNKFWKDSEIVAVNPQCYPDPRMACEAVERAKKQINSEGLHVVEHILLRPGCAEDCRCDQYSRYCEDSLKCCFTWQEPGEDPCAVQDEICLTPGADPYSFIATVALPAWPRRFRKPENRQFIENILHREAPAHVLLRVLWLAPYDFCCFEKKYKSWGRWLAGKKSCPDKFSSCDFMEFLFSRNYECLEECDTCLPCRDEEKDQDPCFNELSSKSKSTGQFLDQVNELYCWEAQYCDEYRIIHSKQPTNATHYKKANH